MRRLHWIPVSMLLVATVLVTACEEGNPVAPPGTILIVTASPSRISLNGQSQIIVEGRRPDGNPLPQGTEIRFATSLGSISPIITEVGSDGRATAILRADGRAGEATVTVTTGVGGGGGGGGGGGDGEGGSSAGGGIATTTVAVLIGETPETARQLLISANPDEIRLGESSTITVIARESDGSTVGAGETILLTTTLGALNPERPTTDQDGVATSRLVSGEEAGQAEITAILGSSEAVTTIVDIRDAAFAISLTANPPSVSQDGGTVELTAFVTNAQGEGFPGAPVTFLVNRGTLGQGGAIPTDGDGIATTTLTLERTDLTGLEVDDTFPVTARTVNAEGTALTSTVNIRVTGGGGGGG